MMPQRYFRVDPEVYEQVRLHLDAIWGHGPGTGTLSCVAPLAEAPVDASGRVLLAALTQFCEYEAVAALLPDLLASGAVEEIDRERYLGDHPPPF